MPRRARTYWFIADVVYLCMNIHWGNLLWKAVNVLRMWNISVTFFDLSATVWMRLICCQFFTFLEEDLKGADEKNPCTTGYFPTFHEVKPRLPAEKQATKIHTCLVFRKLTWIRQSVIHIADIRQDATNAQTSFCPTLKEFLATGFSVHPPIMPIRTHLSKFCYTTSWLPWKVHCHFTDTVYTS